MLKLIFLIVYHHFVESISDSYKVLNLATEDLPTDEWNAQLIFFAFPEQINDVKIRKYFVDSFKNYPNHHRVLSETDVRSVDGNSGWEEVFQFWAYTEEKSHLLPYTVLYVANSKTSYRSQIIEGDGVMINGWTIHSTFWAYSTPGRS